MAAIAAISYAKLVFSRRISNYAKFSLYSNPLKLHICAVIRPNPICPVNLLRIHPTTKPSFRICTIAENVAVEENTETTPQENQRQKLYIHNLPWTMTRQDIKSLFDECGTVVDIELMKQRNGKNAGFTFVTMATREEGQAAVEKFNASEVSGRIIMVDFAKSLKKTPEPPLPEDPSHGEARNKLYLSNLAWKVRSTHLKEFFSAFNPVSARVVFASPGKSAGYGFVSFSTKEEAEAAMASLDGKVLLNRTVRLKFSESKNEGEEASENVESENKAEEVTEEVRSENKAEEETEKVISENEVQGTIEEEVEAAIASLDGKELMNRAVRLKFSESKNKVEEPSEKVEFENKSEDKAEKVVSENKAEEVTKEVRSENKTEEDTEKVISENEVQETIEVKLGDS